MVRGVKLKSRLSWGEVEIDADKETVVKFVLVVC